MADANCLVCLEPWEIAYVQEDFKPWERELFVKGAGCPECAGVPPEGLPLDSEEGKQARFETIRRARYQADQEACGQDSFLLTMMRYFDSGEVPEWKVPDPRVYWTCDGCAVSAVLDPEDDEQVVRWKGGRRMHYERGVAYSYGEIWECVDPGKKPSFTLNGKSFCPGCAVECGNCTNVIFKSRVVEESNCADTYDPGRSFSNPLNAYGTPAICVSCYEQIPSCGNCGDHHHDPEDVYEEGCSSCKEEDDAAEEE